MQVVIDVPDEILRGVKDTLPSEAQVVQMLELVALHAIVEFCERVRATGTRPSSPGFRLT